MAAKRTRLELTWIGKDDRPRLEPRILLEDPKLSYHARKRVSDVDLFENLLIHGDNLLALKALEQDFAGMVKCIYIDPPFNTGQAFEHYDDGVEHSLWLDLMSRRVEILSRLLREDGAIFIHLDQEEVHYLKVILDEIMGRKQFLGQIAYERSGVSGIGQGGAFVVNTHEYILAYCKDRAKFAAVDLLGEGELDSKAMKRYNRVLLSPGERIEHARFTAPSTGEPVIIYKHTHPALRTISLRRFDERLQEIEQEYAACFDNIFRLTSIQAENTFQNRILSYCSQGVFSADYLSSRGRKGGEIVTNYYIDGQAAVWLKDTAMLQEGKVVRSSKLSDFWPHSAIPKANLANEGNVDFRRGKKPEFLLRRILQMVTREGDIVLDSFAGSGTTGAVAHKMRRRWIMIELGDHCKSHVVPRLRSVIDGVDTAGISSVSDWKGGGGFRYLRLADSLLDRDKWGNWIVSKEYKPEMLAEAMCKLEGFRYAPDPDVFWIHGHSTETDLIYVTTQNLSHEQLLFISEQVGDEHTLLICCSAFRANPDAFANLTLKKIPQAVLHRCEWGRDDYSLNVNSLPGSEPEADQTDEGSPEDTPAADTTTDDVTSRPARRRGRPRRQSSTMQELPLFANYDQGGDA